MRIPPLPPAVGQSPGQRRYRPSRPPSVTWVWGPLEAYLCGLAEGVCEGLAWCLYVAAPGTELLPCLLPIRTPSRTVEVTRTHIQACPVYRGPGFVCLIRGREP